MRDIEGRCLCGAVAYSVPDDFQYVGFCHCSDCRRFSGSAFSAMGGIPIGAFRVIEGQESIGRYAKSESTVLGFCRQCGSSLFAEKPGKGMLHLRLGTLNSTPSLALQFHSYVGSKADWIEIRDGLPQYPAGRPAGFAVRTRPRPEAVANSRSDRFLGAALPLVSACFASMDSVHIPWAVRSRGTPVGFSCPGGPVRAGRRNSSARS